MGSCSEMDAFCGPDGVSRPTFLPLSLKRNGFYPTLPETPEHGALYEAMLGMRNRNVTDWDLLSSSKYDVSKEYCDDTNSDVFSLTQDMKTAPRSPITEPPSSESGKKRRGLCSNWGSGEDKDNGNCCSQWFRAYICKLWTKSPPEPPPPMESTPRPKQLTILERESTFKQISPKRLRRFSKKRQSTACQFVYAAYVEDVVVELREERHEDVVYSIYIKKDGSLPRSESAPKSLSDDDIMKEKCASRHLKGATLDFLVNKLARVFVGENEDANFLNVFLTTYRTFSSPEELFSKLHDEYMKLKSESCSKNIAVLKSIVRVFRAWLERYLLDDFHGDEENKLLKDLHALARVHDDVMNENDGLCIEKRQLDSSSSPILQRRNGIVSSASFADYVAAKFAVVAKSARDAEAQSPHHSPSHSQKPSLDLRSPEGTLLNSAVSKTLLTLSSRHVATQLTVIAAKLFHRVQPHHCLATVASSKNRPKTVRATIDQFNRVVYCVVGTILCPTLKVSQRTKLLTKWVEVAQECRELKNFSTLRAIVSGLQTHSLHRLKRAWLGVPQSHTNLLKELSEMNMKDLLLKVGTAKVNTEDSAIHRVRKEAIMRRVQDMHSGIMHGTVPYLGSFLTDLTYLDTARPNYLEGGLINFEKRRKEFELLAQLQLWQASCRSYQNLEPDEEFKKWFQSVTVLTEEQTFTLSKMIEPPASSIASPSHVASPRKSLADMIHSEAEKNMNSSPLFQKNSKKSAENGNCVKDIKFSQSFSGRINTSFTPSPNDKNRIVRIRLVRCKEKTQNGDVTDNKHDVTNGESEPVAVCDYKTIAISSDERRAAVVKRALEAFMLDVEANLKRFSLVQLLHDKEIQIPDAANVFYAMSTSDSEPTLVLLEEGAEIPQNKVKRHQSTPNRPKKHRHRKNLSVNLESESGRASPLHSVTSPMRSLKQLAVSSVALVSGSSYSPSNASRRSSDGESEVAGDGSVVLLNSRSGSDYEERNQNGKSVGLPPAGYRRPSRCHSADFANQVVLPVRVVRPSVALSSSPYNGRLPKSAPSSPQQNRKTPSTPSPDILTATGRLTEWTRYVDYGDTKAGKFTERAQTWSSRRAIRRPKKNKSLSTFYLDEEGDAAPSDEPLRTPDSATTSKTRSRFYVNLENDLPDLLPLQRPTSLYNRSFSSQTLPPRFAPDFSGHDYEEARSATSLTNERSSTTNFSDISGRSNSFASVNSNHSQELDHKSDNGSGINFSVATSEETVFDESGKSPDESTHPRDGAKSSNSLASFMGPIIKIQCASPNKLMNESGFFESAALTHSDTDSQDEGNATDDETDTYL